MPVEVSAMSDPYDLERFVKAQAGVYEQVCAELRAGRKRSHWMWFIFPQIQGLGSSPMAVRYGLSSLEEARAYLGHRVLGARLRECTTIVLGVSGRTVGEIFGAPDDLKFHSSMTLFAQVDEGGGLFTEVLERYFDGKLDRGTLARVRTGVE
ncbi:DUF1810 domain-containing protein [Granulicella sp. dw_53]|uniref:DUF1810 domain-containing protein n=1 Tax=Granulicella sp. dw_53 TaxID=2719792 RepID=UPI001C4A5FBA|nr:DUF1810 domain-containing protein [Granulicella sp. dw_53]